MGSSRTGIEEKMKFVKCIDAKLSQEGLTENKIYQVIKFHENLYLMEGNNLEDKDAYEIVGFKTKWCVSRFEEIKGNKNILNILYGINNETGNINKDQI